MRRLTASVAAGLLGLTTTQARGRVRALVVSRCVVMCSSVRAKSILGQGGRGGAAASRSVVLRLEIGPLPPRDRSYSASKSVIFRTEIGPPVVEVGADE